MTIDHATPQAWISMLMEAVFKQYINNTEQISRAKIVVVCPVYN